MAVGIDAINQYLNNKTAGDRFIIQNNELHLVNKGNISGWTCFKAKFGFGEASMRKVASFINRNRNNLFPDETKDESINNKNAINNFIKGYNANRTFSFKKGKHIKDIEAETIAFFGVKEWAKAGFKVKDAPPIPANLKQIYSAPCPIWKNENKTVGETHIHFLVPKMLIDKKTTVNRLRKITKKVCPLHYFKPKFKVPKWEDGHKSIKQSYWVLMTKNVVPLSRGIAFDWKHVPDNYDLPYLIEADVCLLTQFLRGRVLTDQSKLMFDNEDSTYCHEVDNHGDRAIVGDCNHKGYALGFFMPTIQCGMAAVQRLSDRE